MRMVWIYIYIWYSIIISSIGNIKIIQPEENKDQNTFKLKNLID